MLFTRSNAKADVATQEIEDAAARYMQASDLARSADRTKRAARKLLDLVPAGRYGPYRVERAPSGRETVDLEAVRKVFATYGLGPVPMKVSADSLKVTKVDAAKP
jgi:hypothetical protein